MAGRASPSRAAGSTTGGRRARRSSWASWSAGRSAWRRRWCSCCAWPGWRWRAGGPGGRAIPRWTLLAALSPAAVLVFVEHAFGDRVQGNWPAIIYPAAVIAAAGLRSPRWRRLYRPAVVLGLAITLAVYLQARSRCCRCRSGSIRPRCSWPVGRSWRRRSRRRDNATAPASSQRTNTGWPASWPIGCRRRAGGGGRAALADVRPAGGGAGWPRGDSYPQRPAGCAERQRAMGGADPLGLVARQRNGQTVEQYRLYRVVGGAMPDAKALPHR